jgi:hypothetical protein
VAPVGMSPAEGERRAMVGYGGQYALAAQAVMTHLASLEWIRIADPSAGAADDFQFQSNGLRHAIQVKWSQYPGAFTWPDLTSPGDASSLIGSLAAAWSAISRADGRRPRMHLRTNDHPHSDSRRPSKVFATATTTAPKHFAAFLATSVGPAVQSYRDGEGDWEQILKHEPHAGWAAAWKELETAVGLPDPDDFPDFLADLQLEFLPLQEAAVVEQPRALDPDLEHLAAHLERLVALPSRKVEYTKKELLAELGWTDRAELRNPHQFPMPIEYGANTAAYDTLTACLADHNAGYIALLGPAGCGKSTLLQDLEPRGRVIRYFSFIPDSAAPFSSRGEAASFLHDLTLSLELAGLPRPNSQSDLTGLQACLHHQVIQAGKEFERSAIRTTVIIDGIDHISREQHPTQSLVEVLPAPAALPAGVVFVIGSQTLLDLPEPIKAQLGDGQRTVDLPPLSGPAITRVIELAGLEGKLRAEQLARAITVSEGHALSLRYLIEELKAVCSGESAVDVVAVDAVLDSASSFGGDVDRRYRGYLAANAADVDVMRILGIASRLRAPVDVMWVATWTRSDALRRFERQARPYFRVDGTVWRFVHNSFRIFLARETASVSGHQDAAREKQIEAEIADICSASGDDWRVYQDEELVHRQRAGQVDKVLDRTRPSILRGQLEALRPSGLVRSDLMVGLRVAADRVDARALIAGLQFSAELDIRDQLLPPDRLAEALVDTSPRRHDLPLILNSSQTGLPWATAMRCSVRLVQRGALEAAEEVIRASGGLVGTRHASSEEDDGRAVRDWAYSVGAISGHEAVIELVGRHLPRGRLGRAGDAEEESVAYWRSVAYAGAVDSAGDLQDDSALDGLGQVIMTDEPLGWRLRYLARRASIALDAGDGAAAQAWLDQYLSLRRETAAGQREYAFIDNAAASVLVGLGKVAEPDFRDLMPAGWLPAWPDPMGGGKDDWPEYASVVVARALQRLRQWVCRDAPAPELPALTRRPDAGQTRYLQALSSLADHYASQLYAEHVATTQPAWTTVDPVFRLLEVPSSTTDWIGWYRVVGNYSDMLKDLIRNCSRHGGDQELNRLFQHFASIWSVPDRVRFWPLRRRLQVMEGFLDAGHAMAKTLVEPALDDLESLLGSVKDDEDAIECALLAAGLRARCGNQERVQPMLEYAVRRSCGSNHYDESRSLLDWANWLLSLPLDSQWTDRYREFASRLVGCDQSLSIPAAGPLVHGSWSRDPDLACTSAEWFCMNGLLSESEVVEALVLEMCADSLVPTEIVEAVAAEMLLPILRWPADDTLHTLALRMAGTPWATALETAEARWRPALIEDAPGPREEGADEGARPLTSTTADLSLGSYRSASALLTALRACPDGDEARGIDLTSLAAQSVLSSAPPLVMRSILRELQRLGMSGTQVGFAAGHALAAGMDAEALALLQTAARNLPTQGWLPYWDGGSRLKLFEAACIMGGPEAKRAAATDLVDCMSGSPHSAPTITTTLRIARMLGGDQAVADGWEDAQAFLAIYAPVEDSLRLPQFTPIPRGTIPAVLSWVSLYLSHPVRDLDFGSRRVLRSAAHPFPVQTQTVLTAAMRRGPQIAEGALDVLVSSQIRGPLREDLKEAIQATIEAPDQINRILAMRVAGAHDIQFALPTRRDLPGFYRLELPPLPDETPSPLGTDNMPMFDPAHPEHRLQPYDDILRELAWAANLDDGVVIGHAANQPIDPPADWLKGDVAGLTAWLGTRGQRHMFRPWAFMHGRRAASRVFAELSDAGAFSSEYVRFFGELLLAFNRQYPELEPIDQALPLPWRTPGTRDYEMKSWTSEVDAAASQCLDYYSTGDIDYVILAESMEWVSSNTGNHREHRKVLTRHAANSGRILMPKRKAWEETTLTPEMVARGGGLDWRGEEFIVRGWDRFGDGPLVSAWLAFHPNAGRELGWSPTQNGFEWIGADKGWRARTLRFQRGSVTSGRQLPFGSYCGEGWQVVVSSKGWAELVDRWSVSRYLEIHRESGYREDVVSQSSTVAL